MVVGAWVLGAIATMERWTVKVWALLRLKWLKLMATVRE